VSLAASPDRRAEFFRPRRGRASRRGSRQNGKYGRDSAAESYATVSESEFSLPSDIPAMFVNYREVTWRE